MGWISTPPSIVKWGLFLSPSLCAVLMLVICSCSVVCASCSCLLLDLLYAFSIVTSVLAVCLCSTRAVPSTLNARCLVFQLPKGMVCLCTVYGIWLYASGSNTLVAEWLQSSHPTYFIQASTSTHVQGRPLSITSAFRIFTHSCRFRP